MILKDLLEHAYIPISYYSEKTYSRHTFATNCLKRGIGLPALQLLMGHDRITTTEIYMRLSPEDAIREFQSKW